MRLNVRSKKMERQSTRYRLWSLACVGGASQVFSAKVNEKKTPRRGDGRGISLILKMMLHLVWEGRGPSSQIKPKQATRRDI